MTAIQMLQDNFIQFQQECFICLAKGAFLRRRD